MIDVVFLLIIFFMVISQFQKIEVEQLELPRAEKDAAVTPKEPTRIIVNLRADGTIVVERNVYTLDNFRALLQRETTQADGKTPMILLRADRKSQWSAARDVLRACAEFQVFKLDVGIQNDGGDA